MDYGNYRHITQEFNQKPPKQTLVTYSTKGNETAKVEETGSIHDGCHSGKPISMAKEEMFTHMLAAVVKG
jgi:hypothetical protein